jgi:hypothetical protein
MKTQTDWLDILHSLVMLREKTFFREAIPVPEKVIRGQLALFNLPGLEKVQELRAVRDMLKDRC